MQLLPSPWQTPHLSSVWVEKSTPSQPMGCRKGGGEAAGRVLRPGPRGRHCLGGQVGGQRKETGGTSATMLNNLTFSRHADPSQVGKLAGRAVAGGDHELALAVHSGAVQVARLAGDVHIVI